MRSPSCLRTRLDRHRVVTPTTLAPAASSCSISTSAGASRMSSVPGLNARPQTAICLPFRSPPKCAEHLLAQAALLPLVDGDHGVEDLQLVADLAPGADGGAHVLGEAAAAEAGPGEQELGPDAAVRAHALAHELDVGAEASRTGWPCRS